MTCPPSQARSGPTWPCLFALVRTGVPVMAPHVLLKYIPKSARRPDLVLRRSMGAGGAAGARQPRCGRREPPCGPRSPCSYRLALHATGVPPRPPGPRRAPSLPAWSLCPESRDVAVPPPSNLSTRSRPSLPFRLVFFSPRTHGRLPSGFAGASRSAPLRGTRSPPLAFHGAGHRLRACGRYPLNDLFPH